MNLTAQPRDRWRLGVVQKAGAMEPPTVVTECEFAAAIQVARCGVDRERTDSLGRIGAFGPKSAVDLELPRAGTGRIAGIGAADATAQ